MTLFEDIYRKWFVFFINWISCLLGVVTIFQRMLQDEQMWKHSSSEVTETWSRNNFNYFELKRETSSSSTISEKQYLRTYAENVKIIKIKNALTIADVTTYLWKCTNIAVWTAQCVWPCDTSEPRFLHKCVNQQNLQCNTLAAKSFPLVELAWSSTVRPGLGVSQSTPCRPRAVVWTASHAVYIGCCVWDLIAGQPRSQQ